MKITKSFIALFWTMGLLLSMYSCKEWGDTDDPAGNQVYPAREPLGMVTAKGLASIDDASFILSKTGGAAIAYDNALYTEVIELTQGTVTMTNPLTNTKLQTGAGISLWAKVSGTQAGNLFSFVAEDGSKVSLSTDGVLTTPSGTHRIEGSPAASRSADGEESSVGLLPADEWRFLAVQINNTACIVYADGEKFGEVSYEKDDALVSLLNSASQLVFGDETIDHLSIDRISCTRNNMIASDWKRPAITKVVTLPDPVYFTDFSSTADLTIVGAGSFTTDPDSKFGAIFQNKASTAPRQNYLLLPKGILSHSAETKEMTINFWVNASNAGTTSAYAYAPLFGAYGKSTIENGGNNDNNWPVFVLQSRGFAQLNCAGWTNFEPAQNVDGKNHVYNEFAWEANDANYINSGNWLEDQKWHLYTIIFTETEVTILMDAEVKNQWALDGSEGQSVSGLFSNGGDFGYICLGGNQAWAWGDNDGGFAFDDFGVYNEALSVEQIQKIISDKSGGGGSVIPADLPEPYYRNTFESAEERTLTIVGAGEFVTKSDKHGQVFQNATSAAPRQNYLLLPEDLLAHSTESKQLTISFWVNASNAGESADYMWAPLFMAYSEKKDPNTWPVFGCEYRGVILVNCAGFCDYHNKQNTASSNTLYHGDKDWLADGEWHYYTVVLDNENAKVYLDGKLANEWNADSNDEEGRTTTQMGLFSNGAELKYICLGGNQAWDWGDNDPGFAFDDITCFNTALTAAQIKALMSIYQ